MNHTTRRTAATLSALAATSTLLGVAPAQAEDVADSRITVRTSDDAVRSGEQFVLRGRLTSEGSPVAGAPVRVKTYRAGAWVPLDGAVVTTGPEGRYRVRVVLSMEGERRLRVVGNPPGDDIRTARRRLVITVR